MKPAGRAVLVLACLASAPTVGGPPKFAALLPDASAAEAFSDRYGRAVVEELAAVLMESADPGCLRDRRLDSRQLAEAAEDILVRLGQRMLDRHKSVVDGPAADAAFEAAAGPGGIAELSALSLDEDVQKVRKLAQLARREATVDVIIEAFDHYVLGSQLPLARSISPTITGSPLLRESRYSEVSDEMERLIRERGGPALKRYVELVLAARNAWEHATDEDADAAAAYGPFEKFAGLEDELRALCIRGTAN